MTVLKVEIEKMSFHDVIEAQRKYFSSGATYPVASRKEALNTLKKLVSENSEALCKAVHDDLKRVSEIISLF